MRRNATKPDAFASEAELCAAFVAAATAPMRAQGGAPAVEWTAYPETGGFDILLSRIADGFQVGVEAKLRLNDLVLHQIMERSYSATQPGPDCRAILVPHGCANILTSVASYIGVTIITCRNPVIESEHWRYSKEVFSPRLPRPSDQQWSGRDWFENLPTARVALPDYVPDVAAGRSAPVQLTHWKIGALKIAVLMEIRGFVTRADFKHIGIDHRRWIAPGQGWLTVTAEGWMPGPRFEDFKGQHPVNFEQIKADFDKWKPPMAALPQKQGALL